MGSDDEVARSTMPNRGYGFEFTVEGNDYSGDIVEVHILSSIEVPYISVLITMFIDPTDFILNQIYGQTHIKFAVRHYGQIHPGIPDESLELDLMYISADYNIEMKNPATAQFRMKNRSVVQITTVCKDPFKIMNTYVNGVFLGNTVSQVITSLLGRVNAAVEMDTSGSNPEVIDQILIPPVTLYQALRYLNKTFGLYNGLSSFYCLQDKPKSRIYIKNLTSKMLAQNTAAIYQLAAGSGNDAGLTPEDLREGGAYSYYTFKNIETQYKGNTALSIFGPRMIHIVKPKDKLYSKIDINTADFIKQNGIIYGGKTIYYDQETLTSDSRVSFFKDHTGYENTQTHINANWSKIFSDLSSIVITLERNVFILPLLKVGDPVMFFSQIDNMKDFGGKYILSATELAFTISKREFDSTAKLTLIRSNRTLE